MTIEAFVLIRYNVDLKSKEEDPSRRIMAEEALSRMSSQMLCVRAEEAIATMYETGYVDEPMHDGSVLEILDEEMARSGFPVVREPPVPVVPTRGDRWWREPGYPRAAW